MRRPPAPELAVAGCAAFWGSLGLVVREIDLSAVTIVTYRVGIAAVAIALWLAVRPDGRGWRLVRERPVRTVLQGVLLAAHWGLFFAAFQRAPVGLVVLLVYVAPLVVAAVAPLALGERLTRRVVVALGLALVGTVLLVGPGAAGAETLGIVYALLAALLLAALIINAKVLSPIYGGRRLAHAQVTIATLVLVPVAIAGDGAWPRGDDVGWVLLLGVVHTALGLAIYLGALGKVPAVHVGVLSYLEPLSAALLGWLVLDEALGVGTVVGGLLVVVAGLLVLGAPGTEEVVASPEVAGVPDRAEAERRVPG